MTDKDTLKAPAPPKIAHETRPWNNNSVWAVDRLQIEIDKFMGIAQYCHGVDTDMGGTW